VDATAFDADSRLIFNSNGEGTITVVHQETPDKYSVVETVKTVPRAKTMRSIAKPINFSSPLLREASSKYWYLPEQIST